VDLVLLDPLGPPLLKKREGAAAAAAATAAGGGGGRRRSARPAEVLLRPALPRKHETVALGRGAALRSAASGIPEHRHQSPSPIRAERRWAFWASLYPAFSVSIWSSPSHVFFLASCYRRSADASRTCSRQPGPTWKILQLLRGKKKSRKNRQSRHWSAVTATSSMDGYAPSSGVAETQYRYRFRH
jgi:hypothetical protein